MATNAVVSNTTPNGPLVDKDGRATRSFLKWLQNIGQTVNSGFDQDGNYQGPIGTRATIAGRRFLATIVQHLSDAGIIEPAGLPPATTTEQGAVILPAGATSNTLGTAAIQPATAFDPAGAAAAAQAAAQTYADTVAATAQSNANAYTNSAITSAFSPGQNVTITTAKLTLAGANGSMTFTNGLLTSQTQAT